MPLLRIRLDFLDSSTLGTSVVRISGSHPTSDALCTGFVKTKAPNNLVQRLCTRGGQKAETRYSERLKQNSILVYTWSPERSAVTFVTYTRPPGGTRAGRRVCYTPSQSSGASRGKNLTLEAQIKRHSVCQDDKIPTTIACLRPCISLCAAVSQNAISSIVILKSSHALRVMCSESIP